jgi:glutamyl-tRNA synthetase
MSVRVRMAPSPTGLLHIGGVHTFLFNWLFARGRSGECLLRIENTDTSREVEEATDQIQRSLSWLGIDWDGPVTFQLDAMDRCRELAARLVAEEKAYDDEGAIRFRMPDAGATGWDDVVRGRIEFPNEQLEDVVIVRSDGRPTYNFASPVEDMDDAITHVIRGDDHISNTPKQIQILRALGHEPPVYAHLPTVLDERGEKMSKRHGAKPVTHYRDEGFLADGVVNYLARLGWSHGDDEIFSREQLLQWFNLDHLGKSAGQFDEAKLRWVNAQHLKRTDDAALAALVGAQLHRLDVVAPVDERLAAMCALFKDRCSTTVELAQWLAMYYGRDVAPSDADRAAHITESNRPALAALARKLEHADWDAAAIQQAFKATLAECGLKMPQLAHPVRVMVFGLAQTPSLDAVLALFDRDTDVDRLRAP